MMGLSVGSPSVQHAIDESSNCNYRHFCLLSKLLDKTEIAITYSRLENPMTQGIFLAS